MNLGIANRPNCCAGCKLPFSRKAPSGFRCRFELSGFPLSSSLPCQPCHTAYHHGCLRVGVPFTTRLRKDKGLIAPTIAYFPHFICECCTVRAQLGRELCYHAKDLSLLMLERMRLIDLLHSWAPSTLNVYNQKLRVLSRFGHQHSLALFCPTPLTAPPFSAAIPLMWAQQQYALQPSQFRKRLDTSAPGATITYGTVRSLRSAAAMFYRLDYQIAHPGKAMLDPGTRPILTNGCSPTDELGYYMMNKGMSRRLGTTSKPSAALLSRHIEYLDASLERRYHAATSVVLRLELVRAGLANLTAWLAWLRSMELFSLRWLDVENVAPSDGPKYDLPAGTGILLLRLLEETKSVRTSTADVVIAGTSWSGLSPQRWLDRLSNLLGAPYSSHDLLFQHLDGTPWDSYYFRNTYLIPSLVEQRLRGDAHLCAFDGSPGNTLADKYWGMNSWRIGARSLVSRKRPNTHRKATAEEVSEHGRWRIPRSSLSMPTAYLQWTIADRLAVTQLCM
jgi:hypothetical protein